ncbi:MAG TPA: hypothetical protein VER11_34355 [Polyangiaceae bacterium]|nr:hypothetical protein [Polyangiaceae bacterium]
MAEAMPWVFGHKLEHHAPSGLFIADIGTLRIGIEKQTHSYAWFVGHVAHGVANSRLLAVDAIKDEIRKLRDQLQEITK